MTQLPVTKIITELLPSTMHRQHLNFVSTQADNHEGLFSYMETYKKRVPGRTTTFSRKKIISNSAEKAVLNRGLYTAVPFPKIFYLKSSSEALLRV